MRTFFCPTLDRLVRDEPGIPAATKIAAARMRPARDICFVLVGNSKCEPFYRRLPLAGKVKNMFVTIVEKTN